LINGLGGSAGFGENVINAAEPRNDDGSSLAIDIRSVFGPAGLNFFGAQYTSLYVNNNGNITFGGELGEYIAAPIGSGGLSVPIIAAYWMDLDTRGGPDRASPGGTSTGSNLVYYDLDTTNHVFTATWDDVGYFASHTGSPNAFQIRLIDVGGGDFDIEFIYESINQSYSDTNDQPGEAPRAGYARGNGAAGVELSLSGDYDSVLDLDTAPGNTGVPGYYHFQVRGGQVTGGDGGGDGSGDGSGGGGSGGGGSGGGEEPPPPQHGASFAILPPALTHEGDSGTTPYDIVIQRTGVYLNAPSVVSWEITIDDPSDFAPGQALSGVVEFAPFQTRAVVHVAFAGDTVFEDDDGFFFKVTQATFGDEVWDPGLISLGLIVNDDPRTTFALAGPVMQVEGQAGEGAFDFVVLRAGDTTAPSTVTWRLDYGTADALDLATGQATSGQITFAPGERQAVISILTQGDTRAEPDETFTLRLISATTRNETQTLNQSTVGAIVDDDVRQTVLVAAPAVQVLPEGDTGAARFTFTVTRIGDLGAALRVPYAVSLPSGGGLSDGEVLSDRTGTLTFAAGAADATVTVSVAGDVSPEDNENFVVTLGGGALNTLTLTGVVLNDDKVTSNLATASVAAAPSGDISTFIQQLAGGGLWSDHGVV
jgi:hypothetical protein